MLTEDADISASEIIPLSTISTTLIVDANKTTPTSAVDSSQQPSDGSNTTLHSIDELTWLGTSITLNETNTVYQVLLNTVSELPSTDMQITAAVDNNYKIHVVCLKFV